MNRTTSKRIRSGRALLLAALMAVGGVGGVDLAVREAQAVVGAPFTPASYAGVARRTSRRTTRRVAYRHGAYGGYGYGYGGSAYAGAIYTLPTGCSRVIVGGVTQYACAGSYYRPYYDGPNLVYVPVQ